MSVDTDWQPAFLAVSTLLGESLQAAAFALGEAGARAVAGPLGSGSRRVRAAAVARTIAGLVVELERSRLA